MSEKVFAKREEILGVGVPVCEIEVPEWGGIVKYVPMTMGLRREIRKKSSAQILDTATGENRLDVDAEKFEIYAVIYCCKDPVDVKKPLFDISDFLALQNNISAGPISKVANKILKESGLSADNIKSSKETNLEGSGTEIDS